MKRGASGLSLVVGIDKPAGMSSHDVVNRCRAVFGEKRVGHTGTLDPLASGVLPVCVGPATRLASFLTEHDKHYRVSIAFGAGTDTDDAAGAVTRTGEAPARLRDERFAREFVEGLVGRHRQMPPVYSAIKVQGEKACDAARKGRIIDLAPRDIEVYDARLEGVFSVADAPEASSTASVPGEPAGARNGEVPGSRVALVPGVQVVWDVAFHVSKGTYIRSLARDAGAALGCPAHVAALARTQVGGLALEECVSLEALGRLGARAALDPVRLLGLRIAYLDEAQKRAVSHGGALDAAGVRLFERRRASAAAELCACTAGVRESCTGPQEGERVALVADNLLSGLYEYDRAHGLYRPCCVFQTGVSRGGDL